jgi:hypothetical protein
MNIQILITILLGSTIAILSLYMAFNMTLRSYYYKKFKRERDIEKEDIENRKKESILGAIYTNWHVLGNPGYSVKRVEDLKDLRRYDRGINLSGYIFIYTDIYSVYIDFNNFKTDDIVLVKDLLVKKYNDFLDKHSSYCLEAKKNVINTMYEGGM